MLNSHALSWFCYLDIAIGLSICFINKELQAFSNLSLDGLVCVNFGLNIFYSYSKYIYAR